MMFGGTLSSEEQNAHLRWGGAGSTGNIQRSWEHTHSSDTRSLAAWRLVARRGRGRRLALGRLGGSACLDRGGTHLRLGPLAETDNLARGRLRGELVHALEAAGHSDDHGRRGETADTSGCRSRAWWVSVGYSPASTHFLHPCVESTYHACARVTRRPRAAERSSRQHASGARRSPARARRSGS